MRNDQGDEPDDADGRLHRADAPEGGEAEQAGPERGDGLAPGDGAARAARVIAYREKVEAVYRAYAIDQGCVAVEKIETDTVTPAMLRIEAEDQSRRLVGFENRLKGKDRLSQKVAKSMDELGRSVDDAFGLVKDAIRYTLCSPEDRYTHGVYVDCERLEREGFERVDRQNS